MGSKGQGSSPQEGACRQRRPPARSPGAGTRLLVFAGAVLVTSGCGSPAQILDAANAVDGTMELSIDLSPPDGGSPDLSPADSAAIDSAPPDTSPDAAEVFSGAFTLVTYNVAGLPFGLSQSDPEVNTPLISPLLNNYDLALLQEDFAYTAQLSSAANHPYISTPGGAQRQYHERRADAPFKPALHRSSAPQVDRVQRDLGR